MALGSHLITVRRLKKYIDDVIGKKANLPDTSKTIIGNISQLNTDLSDLTVYRNNLETGVNITSYNSTSNMYTFPEDGYVELHRSGSQSGSITAFIYGATGDSTSIMSGLDNSAYQTVYVRKGMRCRIRSSNASYHVAMYYAFKE